MRPHHARQVADEHDRRDAAGRPYKRAPGEVETVARAIRDPDKTYPMMFSWPEIEAARRVIAALDAARGQSE